MAEKIETLEKGKYYHIYNRGINGCELFRKETNYEYFLKLYSKHISPIADTYAWVLMGNHFHFLIYIKEIEHLKPPHQHFSNMFNAYTKAFNKMEDRHGNLFERPFHRKRVDCPEYFKKLIIYIHQNPIKHIFCNVLEEYYWSSYRTCYTTLNTLLKRDEVIGLFNDLENFRYLHQVDQDLEEG